jgi:hypothetical protein
MSTDVNALKQKYAAYAERNNDMVGQNEIIVPCLITMVMEMRKERSEKPSDVVEDKKSRVDTKKAFVYHLVQGITLNRKEMNMNMSTFNKVDNKRCENKQDINILHQHSSVAFTTFDQIMARKIKSMTPCVCKVYLRAERFQDRISYTAGRIMCDELSNCFNTIFYNRYIKGGPLSEIPTLDNIKPESFAPRTEEKYMYRHTVLPLTTHNSPYTAVVPLVDFADRRRLTGSNKDSDEIVPSVTVENSMDKVSNGMNVMFVYKPEDNGVEKNTLVKFGYFPSVWTCFGVSSVEKWIQCAGTLISGARGWYAVGSAKLENIKRLSTNAAFDNEVQGDDSASVVSTTVFISAMHLDLYDTVAASGRVLAKDWVADKYSIEKYNFTAETGHENPINLNCYLRLREVKAVFNITEMNDPVRAEFIRRTKDMPDVVYYGVFPYNVNAPYEAPNIMDYLATPNCVLPSVVFACIQA